MRNFVFEILSIIIDWVGIIPGFIVVYPVIKDSFNVVLFFSFLVTLHTFLSLLISKKFTIGNLIVGIELSAIGHRKYWIYRIILRESFYIIMILSMVCTRGHIEHIIFLMIGIFIVVFPRRLADGTKKSYLDIFTKTQFSKKKIS